MDAITTQIHPFYYARHSTWQGPFTLLANGTFIGGKYKPNGFWKCSEDSSLLTLTWHSWGAETLFRIASGGYAGKHLILERISRNSSCYTSHRMLLHKPIPERGLFSFITTGLCDRLTTLLLFKEVAINNDRQLYWGWPLNSACNCSFHKLFQANGIEVIDSCIPLGIQIKGWSANNSRNVLTRKVSDNYATPWIFLKDAYYGHNYEGFDSTFNPSDEVALLIENYIECNWRATMIGVHVRRGDKSAYAPELSSYIKEADFALDTFPEAGIFLCSDDPKCERDLKERYGNRLVTYPVRSYHRDIEEGVIDALVCLYLLRRTSGVIGSSMSGFSLCGGWECGFVDIPSRYENKPTAGPEWKIPLPSFRRKELF